MSDILDFLSVQKYKNSISVNTNHCLSYANHQSVSDKEIIITIHVSHECLRHWYEARQEALQQHIPCAYIEILNVYLNANAGLHVKEDCERIEGRLRRTCSDIMVKFKYKNGTK